MLQRQRMIITGMLTSMPLQIFFTIYNYFFHAHTNDYHFVLLTSLRKKKNLFTFNSFLAVHARFLVVSSHVQIAYYILQFQILRQSPGEIRPVVINLLSEISYIRISFVSSLDLCHQFDVLCR
jgi:uncharacterized membrane protein